MVPSYLNNDLSRMQSRKVQRWKRFRRRMAVYGYVIFVFSGLFAFWLNLSQILTILLSLKHLSGSVVFTTFGIFVIRVFNLKQVRSFIEKKRSTNLRYGNVYAICQILWLTVAVIGTLFNPLFKNSADQFLFVLPIAAIHHLIFLNYLKHLKVLEVRLAGLGVREEKLTLSLTRTPLPREIER